MSKLCFSTIAKKVLTLRKMGYFNQPKAKLDFSLSENPFNNIPQPIKKAIIKGIPKINQYPKKEVIKLRLAIAKKFSLNINNIALGNGLEQVIDVSLRAILNSQNEVLLPLPSFFLFEKAVLLAQAKPVFIIPKNNLSLDLERTKQAVTPKTKLIIFSNPNNPTGQIIPKKKLLIFINALPNIFIIIDEANIEFGGQSLVKEVKNFPNLIILRSFSKAFGLAGLRAGFCAGTSQFIGAFDNLNQPFPLNSLTSLACLAALKNNQFIARTKKLSDSERNFLMTALSRLGFTVFPSQANNILIKTDFAKFTNFLRKNNISVVDCSCFRGLKKGFFRISPRNQTKNQRLVNLLKKYYK